METGFDRDDARIGGVRRIDAARTHADQLTIAWLLVCGDFRCGIDRGNALDVGIDRFTFRVQLGKAESSSSGTTNSRRRLQHLLRHLVRLQSSHPVKSCQACNPV